MGSEGDGWRPLSSAEVHPNLMESAYRDVTEIFSSPNQDTQFTEELYIFKVEYTWTDLGLDQGFVFDKLFCKH